jgi:hypothetical protein
MFVFQNGRIEMRFYRARVALAGATMGDYATLRAVVADARRLERENALWASALATLLRGSVAYCRGRTEEAARRLEAAETALLRCDMFLYAAAARYRRGGITDGEQGPLLMESARQMMQSQQIANPSRLVALLTPGPWPS